MKKRYNTPSCHIVDVRPTTSLLLPISDNTGTDESLVSRQIDEEIWNTEDYWESPFER